MKAAALALCLAFAAPCWADVARPSSLIDTLNTLAAAYEATGQFTSVTIDPAANTVSTTRNGGDVLTSSVLNLHQILLSAPDDAARQDAVDNFVAGMVENLDRPGPSTSDATRIFPLIRHKDYAAQAAGVPYSEPFIGDLRVYYVLDLPSSMPLLSEEEIIAAGLQTDTLRDTALENFAPLQASAQLQGQDVWMVVLDGNYELTLLLDADIWAALDAQIGTIVAIPAARDLLLIADADVPRAVDRLRGIVATNWDTLSYTISKDAIVWTGAGWAPYGG